MPRRPVTLVLGDINRDLFVHLPLFPKPGRDNPAEKSVWALGGSAFNTAAALARLRISTGVMGRVGSDNEGRLILREMTKLGISTRAVQKDPSKPTGICIIPVTPDGERTLIGVRGANAALSPDLLQESLQGCRHLHVSGYALTEPKPRAATLEALRVARLTGATTSLDFTWHATLTAPAAIREALADVSVALPSASELRAAMGLRRLSQAAQKAIDCGAEQVAATLGAGGCRLFFGRESFRVPSFPTRIVNTCGAGDAFNAGYIFGLIKAASPLTCAFLGNAAGALAVSSEHPYLSLDRTKMLNIVRSMVVDPQRMRLIEALRDATRLLGPTANRARRRLR